MYIYICIYIYIWETQPLDSQESTLLELLSLKSKPHNLWPFDCPPLIQLFVGPSLGYCELSLFLCQTDAPERNQIWQWEILHVDGKQSPCEIIFQSTRAPLLESFDDVWCLFADHGSMEKKNSTLRSIWELWSNPANHGLVGSKWFSYQPWNTVDCQ